MPPAILHYALTFSRIAIGLTFAFSTVGKLHDFRAFERAIENFQLLPRRLIKASAFLFLAGEMAVPVLMVCGAEFLWIGFLLAVSLLSLFCIALVSVLLRRIQTPCACFGSSQRPVSLFNVWRDVGFIACALVGVGSLSTVSGIAATLSLGEVVLMAVMALMFVAVLVYLDEVIELFCVS